VPVPQGTRGKDLSVIIQKTKLSVGLRNQSPILAGDLCKEIKVDDSSWTLRELDLSLFVFCLQPPPRGPESYYYYP